ncbi:MAG: Fur family transcriptional regulator [Candidatus Kapaibacteriales bacterium]
MQVKKRQTPAKKNILELLKRKENPLTPDMVYSDLSEKHDKATVYRVLNGFCEEGLVHKVVSDSGQHYYAICETECGHTGLHSHQHAHFQCTECEKAECLDSNIEYKLPTGYSAQETNIWIKGLCADCSN